MNADAGDNRRGRAGCRGEAWLTWAALLALWAPLMWRWHHVWMSTPDQAFGWAVPLLAMYLFHERWGSRPVVRGLSPVVSRLAWGAVIFGVMVVALSLPVLEANLFWPRAQWSGALGAILATAGGLALRGGWRWSAHFGFPLVFITTALSWPSILHTGVVTGLGGINAWLAAEFSSICGRPALATGNIIEVGVGFVGVDEACSGLRSLQAVWMVGWFFGELHRLGWPRRVGLVLLALATAFVGNVVRTVFLTWQAAAGGAVAVAEWHDTAGGVILLITLVVVALLGWWFSRGTVQVVNTGMPDTSALRFPTRAAWLMLVGGVLGSLGTEAWFSFHERKAAAASLWRLTPPNEAWDPVTVPEKALSILGNPDSEGYAWTGAANQRGLAYIFRWEGDIAQAGAAELHDPTICLPSVGAVLEDHLEPETLLIQGESLEFQVYRFDTVHGIEYVFFGLWDGNLEEMRNAAVQQLGNVTDFRLRLVGHGSRRAKLAHITFVTAGIPEASMAREWLREWAPRLLTVVH